MSVLLSPVFNLPSFVDANGNPLSGGKVYAYVAGSSSVLQTTYTSSTGLVANANPIVLDSAGRLPSGIALWLTRGLNYHLVLTQSDGTTVLSEFDDIAGVEVPTITPAADITVWVELVDATYLAPTQFKTSGNLTSVLTMGARVRCTVATGTRGGTITASTYSGGFTTVTLSLDGGVLDSSLSLAEYSVLQTPPTVDAGSVAYFDSATYATSNTVGNKFKSMEVEDDTTNTRIDALRQVWLASYAAGAYAITPSPSITSYTQDAVFTVAFANASSGSSTLNVNGIGAKGLKAYDDTGAKVDAVVAAQTVGSVAYDGVDFVLLTQLPPTPPDAAPRGLSVFTANGNFTVPTGVTWLKVTCVGGGGGAGSGYAPDGYAGGNGGGGACAIKGVSTTEGTVYAVSVGAGGTGAVAGTAASGGSTSFGISVCVAGGGAGGVSYPSSTDGAAGTSGSGDLILPGGGAASGGGYSPGATLYGGGAYGTTSSGTSGKAGVCIVEY